MEKIIILLTLIVLSIAMIHLARRLEQKTWFKKIDLILGVVIILVLVAWGLLEILSDKASFFLINLKPLNNINQEQNPALFWMYVFAKFYFAFLFMVMVKRIYSNKS
ncbi:MAG: hypothetical protein JSW33_07150 [bacterium]|nr:MAG: hypothetical protein JSW33_07150 [bacterium]